MNPAKKALWFIESRLATEVALDEIATASGASRYHLPLVEPIDMDQMRFTDLTPPRFETGKPLLVAGLGERYRFETNQGIPAQWQRFVPYIGQIAGQIGWTTYGVCCNGDGNGAFDYIAGVEVRGFDELPPALSRVRIPEGKYAVFSHRGHISTFRTTVYTIWNKWLPESGLKVAETPDFERYDDKFDPQTGAGEIEIWIPIRG